MTTQSNQRSVASGSRLRVFYHSSGLEPTSMETRIHPDKPSKVFVVYSWLYRGRLGYSRTDAYGCSVTKLETDDYDSIEK